jgi:hypothetical protein
MRIIIKASYFNSLAIDHRYQKLHNNYQNFHFIWWLIDDLQLIPNLI